MKNKEKYVNEIIDMALRDRSIAVNNKTRKPCRCGNLRCKDCFFDERNYIEPQDNCHANRIHWANSEYVEPKEFTEQEKAAIRALDKVKWVAKNKCGSVEGFIDKPYKDGKYWVVNTTGEIYSVIISKFTSCKFKAIKWEDDEPTSREEILGEEK